MKDDRYVPYPERPFQRGNTCEKKVYERESAEVIVDVAPYIEGPNETTAQIAVRKCLNNPN